MIRLQKSTATVNFRPVELGGNSFRLEGNTQLRANVKADLSGYGGCHVTASNNFGKMCKIIAERYKCTVQRAGYEAKPAPYVFRLECGEWRTYKQNGKQLLHVVFHGVDCEVAADDLQKRFSASLAGN